MRMNKKKPRRTKKKPNTWVEFLEKGVWYLGAVVSSRRARLSLKEQIFFAKQLSFLLGAQVTLTESLEMVRAQTGASAYQRALTTVQHEVANGRALSKSLGKFPHFFSALVVNLVRAGEVTGQLPENLAYAAEELVKKQKLRRKVVGALVYPAMIVVLTLGITVFLMVYLFPKIMPVFLSLKVALPFSTRAMIAISTLVRHEGLVMLLVLVLGGVGAVFVLKRYPHLQLRLDALVLGIPLLGRMLQQYALARTARTLGLMLRCGILLPDALRFTAGMTTNLAYRESLERAQDAVATGKAFSKTLALSPHLYPALFVHVLMTGERGGGLSDMLLYLGEFYEREVEDITKDLSTLIEPALMLGMGLLVGFVAISIIAPIYGLTEHLNG